MKTTLFFIGIIVLVLMAPDVMASGSGGDMPWEGPLTKIKDSLSGPVALGISIIGIVVAGGMLIFGGELGEFARRIIMLVLVISLLVTANSLLTSLFTTGASIDVEYSAKSVNSQITIP